MAICDMGFNSGRELSHVGCRSGHSNVLGWIEYVVVEEPQVIPRSQVNVAQMSTRMGCYFVKTNLASPCLIVIMQMLPAMKKHITSTPGEERGREEVVG